MEINQGVWRRSECEQEYDLASAHVTVTASLVYVDQSQVDQSEVDEQFTSK